MMTMMMMTTDLASLSPSETPAGTSWPGHNRADSDEGVFVDWK